MENEGAESLESSADKWAASRGPNDESKLQIREAKLLLDPRPNTSLSGFSVRSEPYLPPSVPGGWNLLVEDLALSIYP